MLTLDDVVLCRSESDAHSRRSATATEDRRIDSSNSSSASSISVFAATDCTLPDGNGSDMLAFRSDIDTGLPAMLELQMHPTLSLGAVRSRPRLSTASLRCCTSSFLLPLFSKITSLIDRFDGNVDVRHPTWLLSSSGEPRQLYDFTCDEGFE